MQWRSRWLFGGSLLMLGYLLGSLDAVRLPRLAAQAGDDAANREAENKIRAVHRALQDAMEQLRQDNNYEAITEGLNAFLILSGGGNARQDLESGNGLDPETFAALYAGKALPEIIDELGADDEGRITYNGKPITIYSRKRLERLFAERLRIKDAQL